MMPILLTEKDPDETKEEEEMRTASESKRNYLEQLKELRDYKRRRQSYRAKNVHITRRTPVQVSLYIFTLVNFDALLCRGRSYRNCAVCQSVCNKHFSSLTEN